MHIGTAAGGDRRGETLKLTSLWLNAKPSKQTRRLCDTSHVDRQTEMAGERRGDRGGVVESIQATKSGRHTQEAKNLFLSSV